MYEWLRPLIEPLGAVLRAFHTAAAPIVGSDFAWGIAIILLTVAVRVVLLPLAIKQISSMRAMQRLQPEMKKIQQKYKADRSLIKTNPEKYRERRQKQQEAMMALYKEHNVNPASSCLPLLAQMPIFFALFGLLMGDYVPELQEAGFYLIPRLSALPSQGLAAAGIGAYLLVVLMAVTTFVSQKQMMANNPAMSTGPMAQNQKVMLYVMPVLLTVFSWNFPVGVLLYWVTTNVWTMAQQWFMFRNVDDSARAGTVKAGTKASKPKKS